MGAWKMFDGNEKKLCTKKIEVQKFQFLKIKGTGNF